MFAKLFETADGQILIMRGTSDDGEPEVRVCFKIDDTTCAIALAFGDDDKADNAFAEIGEEKAVELVRKLKDNIKTEKDPSE